MNSRDEKNWQVGKQVMKKGSQSSTYFKTAGSPATRYSAL